MGTWLRITLLEPRSGAGGALLQRAFEEARKLDGLLSHYRSDSALSRLNARAGRGPQEVPPDLLEALRASSRLSELTEGAFDVTVGPLLEEWKLAGRRGRPPVSLKNALRSVGWQLLEFPGGNRVALRRREMRINLGAIGKGFAVDRIVRLFRRAGVCCALIDFGESSLFALGRPPGAEAWSLLVRGPRPDSFLGVVSLRDRALSVSSAFGRTFVIRGKTYGHILDPRTGRPLTRPAVTVVAAPTATEAEALSTALLVLGPKEGLSVVRRFRTARALHASMETVWLSPCFRPAWAFRPDAPVVTKVAEGSGVGGCD